MNTDLMNLKNMISDLSSSNDFIRLKARRELLEAGKPAYASLLQALKHRNCLVRWEVVNILGATGDPELAPALVGALEDREFEVRWVAAEALTRIMGKGGLKTLFQALIEHADSAFLREGAHHVFHKLSQGDLNGELRVLLTPILIALESREPAVEIPLVALRSMETMDEALKAAHEVDRSNPLYSILAAPTGMNPDLTARKRSQKYVKSLQCGELPSDQNAAKA
jgi:hypothetical protein